MILKEWYCPCCNDYIEDLDSRIEHLVTKHNVSVNIVKLAGGEQR